MRVKMNVDIEKIMTKVKEKSSEMNLGFQDGFVEAITMSDLEDILNEVEKNGNSV